MAAAKPSTRKGGKTDDLSPLAENYLLTLYQLQEEEQAPTTLTRVAEHLALSPVTEHLGTSLASVAGMIRRMKRDGLVDVKPSKEIVFTQLGHRHAEALMRRHQLAERLLVDVLGLDLHKVHGEAHRLEHAISPAVEEKLQQRLDHPLTCPFGHPIPGNGYEPPKTSVPLDRIKVGGKAVVERIPEYDPRLVEYLVANDVMRGQTVEVIDIAPYKGTMSMLVNGHEVVIGLQVAPKILVDPAGVKASAA